MAIERKKEIVVDLKSWTDSIEYVCGSMSGSDENGRFYRASTCVQIVFDSGAVQLLACDGSDFRSSKVLQPVPKGMHASIVVDKTRLRLIPKMFEGASINMSLSEQELNLHGLGVSLLSLPDVSERLKDIRPIESVDFRMMYQGYEKPACEIMLPLETLKKIITHFDYRRKIDDPTIELSTPEPGKLKINQGYKKNYKKEASIDFIGNGTLPVPVRLDQLAFKGFIKTVNFPSLLLGASKSGMLYFRGPMSTFEAFILGLRKQT